MGDVAESFGENGICAVCRRNPVNRWCDYVISYENTVTFVRDYKCFIEINKANDYETCDLPMCASCAAEVSLDRHLCPHHMELHKKAALPDKYQQQRQRQEKRKIAIEG